MKLLARALYRTWRQQQAGKGLPVSLTDVTLSGRHQQAEWQARCEAVESNLKTPSCHLTDAPPATPELLMSPDRSQALLTRNNDLFVRDVGTGQERALTTDGMELLSWAQAAFLLILYYHPHVEGRCGLAAFSDILVAGWAIRHCAARR